LEPASALLTDRVAVVTGAAVGIGRGVALALAGYGAHVA
jgi:NAD(P)-dependent dehydrogenase (short-subunit alcohol dehydrogenase family)